MLPFSIGTNAGTNAGDEDDGQGAQMRRNQVVRLGLIICLLLALFDSGPGNRPISSLSEHSDTTARKPTAATERLNSVLNSKRSLALRFPRNVTGLYRGSWDRSSHIVTESARNSSSRPGVAWGQTLSENGKILMQLKSVAIDNVAELSFVYGIIRLSGAGPRNSDMLYPVQGVFVPTAGQLTLITSPYSGQKLYVQVPANDKVATINETYRVSAFSHSHDRRRMLSSLPELQTDGFSKLAQFVHRQREKLQLGVLNANGQMLSAASKLSEQLGDNAEFQLRRRLIGGESTVSSSSSGGMYSAVLPYGMRLMLADQASAAEQGRARNGTYFMESVSDGLLPSTFKNLQYGVMHGMGQATGCQMSVSFAAAALIANQNDRDIPLLPGISTASPKLTPSVGSGESFSSNLKGGMQGGRQCGVENSGFNITAQSYHLQVNMVERKAFNYAIVATFSCFVQMGLLILQLRHAQNPAMATKISVVGMCAQALIDALICIGHLLLCAAIPGIFFQHFMWIAALKLLIFCAFEMRMVVGVYHARYAQEASTLGWAGLRRRLASLHFRFYAALFVAMLVTISLRSQPVLIILLLYSCWVPQIVYNATAGTRRAFHPVYMYGMALTRMFIPLYVFGCPHNFLSLLLVETASFTFSPAACFVLIVWTALQVGVLAVQDMCGARFFVPKQWLPLKYDYNRPVPRHVLQNQSLQQENASSLADSGETLASASASSTGTGSGTGSGTGTGIGTGSGEPTAGPNESITCVVCYNAVQLTYGEYMIAPCDHVFHHECLSRWMTIKLECPTCRSPLEPEDTT